MDPQNVKQPQQIDETSTISSDSLIDRKKSSDDSKKSVEAIFKERI
mgnify:CR=1 FL=1